MLYFLLFSCVAIAITPRDTQNEILSFLNQVDPATPASGLTRLWVDTDKLLKIIDDTGTVTIIGSGGGGGALTPTTVKTSAYTAVVGDYVRGDASGGDFVVTMTATPTAGDEALIVNEDDTGVITVKGDGADIIEDDNETFLYGRNAFIHLIAIDASTWKIIASDLKFYGEGNIGGANPSYGLGVITVREEITDTGLDLVIIDSDVIFEASCTGSGLSSGLTCGVAETLGFNYPAKIPATGKYRACFRFTHSTAGGCMVTYEVVQVPEGCAGTPCVQSDVILFGEEKRNTFNNGASDVHQTIDVCGVFKLAQGAINTTLILMREQRVCGGGTNQSIMDRNAVDTDRDLHFSFKYLGN